MRVTDILLLDQHLIPDYAHPAHPPPHTHTNKKDTVYLMTSAHPTQPFSQFPSQQMHKFSYHTTVQK